jgi:hypothetical protein
MGQDRLQQLAVIAIEQDMESMTFQQQNLKSQTSQLEYKNGYSQGH